MVRDGLAKKRLINLVYANCRKIIDFLFFLLYFWYLRHLFCRKIAKLHCIYSVDWSECWNFLFRSKVFCFFFVINWSIWYSSQHQVCDFQKFRLKNSLKAELFLLLNSFKVVCWQKTLPDLLQFCRSEKLRHALKKALRYI